MDSSDIHRRNQLGTENPGLCKNGYLRQVRGIRPLPGHDDLYVFQLFLHTAV